jgi:hypothetical protein
MGDCLSARDNHSLCFQFYGVSGILKRSFSLSLSYSFCLLSIYILAGLSNIVVVAVLAAAGAGGVQFLCFSKTERGQNLALLVYIVTNVFLGFLFRKEGEIFPKVTICFLSGILALYIYLWLTSKTIYSILSESFGAFASLHYIF